MSIFQNYSWKDKLVLIVDDDHASLLLLEVIIAKTGAKMIVADSGRKGLEIFLSTKGIDLILMDIKMPNLDGLEATKIIRELSHTVPIIAQSAYAYQQDQIAAMDAGCSDFIAKPISQAKLKDMINKWLP